MQHDMNGRLTWPDGWSQMTLIGILLSHSQNKKTKTTKAKQKQKQQTKTTKHKNHTAHRLFTAVLPSELIRPFKI
jgi:hypothetical protein